MNKTMQLLRNLLVLWTIVAATQNLGWAASQPLDPDKTLKNLLEAIETGNRAQFSRDGDEQFKRNATQEIIDKAKEAHAARLKQGHKAIYLAEMKQQGCRVHVWKLTFTDGGDDLLIRVAFEDGKVHAFLVH